MLLCKLKNPKLVNIKPIVSPLMYGIIVHPISVVYTMELTSHNILCHGNEIHCRFTVVHEWLYLNKDMQSTALPMPSRNIPPRTLPSFFLFAIVTRIGFLKCIAQGFSGSSMTYAWRQSISARSMNRKLFYSMWNTHKLTCGHIRCSEMMLDSMNKSFALLPPLPVQ